MASAADTLKWSAQLQVAPISKRLIGDKITLPQSALEALLAAAPVVSIQNGNSRNLTSTFDPFNPYSYAAERFARDALSDRQQQLPHPLTFRLVNPENGRAVYAGIREFSAEDNQIGLSNFLRDILGLRHDSSQQSTRQSTPQRDVDMMDVGSEKEETITIHAKQLPKGTYARLRPLESGYDVEDWKSILERYLRDNFTTLTKGEVLDIHGGRHEHFRFLVDKFEPDGEGICIVDTDLEVDIEALNEEQARETLNKQLAKRKRAPETVKGSPVGGLIEVGKAHHGQVLPGEYVDYELKNWNRQVDLEVKLESGDESAILDVFVNPMWLKQRSKPRDDEHVFGDMSSRPTKRLKLSHSNVEMEEAEQLSVAVHAWSHKDNDPDTLPLLYTLTIKNQNESDISSEVEETTEPSPDEVVCKNCQQHIPKRTLPLHEAFCYRNNIRCPKCSNVFLKNSEAWKSHWHCPHDLEFGNGEVSRSKHDSIFHPSNILQCPNCDFQAFNLPILAHHRTTTCPGKEILCQFCHLVVPQQGPEDPSFTDAEVLLSGLTPHELADGARTTECHLCNKIVRLRDMKTHMKFHDRERLSRPQPKLCVNGICNRSIKSGEETRVVQEQLGLCNECFGPLYVTTYDPEGKALRRRTERRLLQQVMGGCGKSWCRNEIWCKTGHKNVTGEDRVLTAKDALPMLKPVTDRLAKGDSSALRFCVDEATQTRKTLAEMMSHEGEYELGWCMKAMEESKGDVSNAREWLSGHAPKRGEVLS